MYKIAGIQLTPAKSLIISFALVIMVGSLLLSLPIAVKPGKSIDFLNALFTSTSAACVTGLAVTGTGETFSTFGQLIILILVQIGGLGLMTFSIFFILSWGRRFSSLQRNIIQDVYTYEPRRDLPRLVYAILLLTFIIEGAGALLLTIRFAADMPFGQAIYYGIFHAISAFCNAGFTLFNDGLISYRDDIWINLIVMLLIILGGLGFIVIREILSRMKRGERRPWSLHTKVVLVTSAVLTAGGAILFFFLERNNSLARLSGGEMVLTSIFQSVTARTAGFNTLDFNSLYGATLSLLIFMMFFGASPGSCGGGVKTTALGVIFALARSRLRGRRRVELFKRTIPEEIVNRALVIVLVSLAVVFLGIGLMLTLEHWSDKVAGHLQIHQDRLHSIPLIFETFSAFGTVGLSTGVTQQLSAGGRIVIIALMFIGRLGPLTLALAVNRRSRGRFEYSEESVMIG